MNIILIGMMGSGKSRLGKGLSKKLDKKFVDTDKLIVEKFGNISKIFETQGETKFREYESQIVKQVAIDENDAIISTGGGVILNKENMKELKKTGVVVYLNVTSKTVFERTRKHERPIIGDGGLERIKEIIKQRQPLYNKYADIIIDGNGYGAELKVGIIIKELNKFLKRNGIDLQL